MFIGGRQKLTLIDYPGKLACTVFSIGCNFRCPFCYSSELVLPEKIKSHTEISDKEFFDFLQERKGLLDGVVLCGGEPTVHQDLPQFCKEIKNLGYLIKLDTNGSNPKMLEKLIEKKLIDYVAMDIKSSKEKYSFFSGAEFLKDVGKSVVFLKQNKIDFEFRTTVSPGLQKEDIFKMTDWIADSSVNYFLQEFNSQKPLLDPRILELSALAKTEIEEIVKEIKPKFKNCYLR